MFLSHLKIFSRGLLFGDTLYIKISILVLWDCCILQGGQEYSLTACNLHWTCLCIKRIQFEVHGTGESEGDPDTEQHGAIRVYPDIQVGNQNIVHGSSSLIAEECVGHPHFTRLSDGQIFYFI